MNWKLACYGNGFTALRAALVGICLTQFAMARDRGHDASVETPGDRNERIANEFARTALLFDLDGEPAWRNRTLSAALARSPDSGPPNWHLGRVQVGGRWRTLPQAERLAAAQRDDYRERRNLAGNNVEKLFELAQWCGRNEQADRAEVHYAQVVLHPAASPKLRFAAFQQLDLHYINGRWIDRRQAERLEQQFLAARESIERWREPFQEWMKDLASNHNARRQKAMREIAELSGVDVVPIMELCIVGADEPFQQLLIGRLDVMPEHEATEMLVRYALLSPFPTARAAAAKALSTRPVHDFVPPLIDSLTAPVQLQYQVTRDASGTLRYTQVVAVETQQQARIMVRDQFAVRSVQTHGRTVGTLAPGESSTTYAGTEEPLYHLAMFLDAMDTQQKINAANYQEAMRCLPIFEALERGTGIVLPRQASAWWEWWKHQNAMAVTKPVLTSYERSVTSYFDNYDVARGAVPSRAQGSVGVRGRARVIAPYRRPSSCFVPGTLVWTEAGRQAIESVQVGDRVLSQDPDTGELAYRVVRLTTQAPSAAPGLIRLTVDGDQVNLTESHVVWIAGRGWEVARDAFPGMSLQRYAGTSVVEQRETLPNPPLVHNLVVDDFHTFFVGQCGLLVHDITPRQPTRAVLPGLIPAPE
ncbi:MAG: hypothetical protein KDA62_00410 [Planctomycetales bacterium]|nr:hypothetical protein [Planctomycetales bacterium]